MIKRKGKKFFNTTFTDEMGICLADDYPKKGWSVLYKRIKFEKPQQNMRINCWAGISFKILTSLTTFKQTLKADRYQDILASHIEEMGKLYPNGYYL